MKFKKPENAWQPEEVALLCKHYPVGGVNAVIAVGVRRSAKSIRTKATGLGIKLSKETRRKLSSAGGVASKKKAMGVVEQKELPNEYAQAADIFQVGYRYFKQFGWGGQHVAA